MQTSFIPGDDDGLANLINHSVDGFCLEMITQKGIEDYRSVLETQVKQAKTIVDTINKKIERIKEGEDILKNICLN